MAVAKLAIVLGQLKAPFSKRIPRNRPVHGGCQFVRTGRLGFFGKCFVSYGRGAIDRSGLQSLFALHDPPFNGCGATGSYGRHSAKADRYRADQIKNFGCELITEIPLLGISIILQHTTFAFRLNCESACPIRRYTSGVVGWPNSVCPAPPRPG